MIVVFQLVQPLNLVRVMQACIHSLMAGQMMDDLRKAQGMTTFPFLQLVQAMQAGIHFLNVVELNDLRTGQVMMVFQLGKEMLAGIHFLKAGQLMDDLSTL